MNQGHSTKLTEFGASAARRGFTLIDLLMAVSILAMLVALVVPAMNDNMRLRVRAAADIIASDIELAQTMTIAQPQDPVVVRFDPDNHRYWLARAADPSEPLIRDDTGEAYLVVLGEGRAASAAGIGFRITDLSDNTLQFDAHGGLTTFGVSPLIQIQPIDSSGSDAISLRIGSTTGSIRYEK